MSASTATSLTITNPLVKYRALLATKAINPDHGQLRLALHLQKLYERLKDYEPQVEYSRRLDQISRAVGPHDGEASGNDAPPSPGKMSTLRSLLQAKEKRDSLALTRRLTSHESAMQLSSPRGLMVHGEVGTGKSMLIDLFADCLPNRKKRRWHFNTFMLETIAKLETFRQDRARVRSPLSLSGSDQQDDYSLLWLARDMIQTSPILFLDEFQMPDRVASKILTNLMTSFFHLGGVLVATSNRMPEELAKASGIEFTPPPSRLESLRWQFGLRGGSSGSSGGLYYGQNEFVAFLEVLKARCEVWEMDGGIDYRRVGSERATAPERTTALEWDDGDLHNLQSEEAIAALAKEVSAELESTKSGSSSPSTPTFFNLSPTAEGPSSGKTYERLIEQIAASTPRQRIAFQPETLNVYGRQVPVPRASNGIAEWTFHELCRSTLGPADYMTLASTYHTLILRDVPVLTWLMKNEARRFITLLDALYECRCKLAIVDAAAGPDDLFFPDETANPQDADDAVYSETLSEVYQDATAPFRPNILTQNPNYREQEPEPDYTHARLAGLLNADALEDGSPHKSQRSSPFGRSFGRTDAEMQRMPIDPDDESRLSMPRQAVQHGPDFGKTSTFTGEDEMFAYRRAQSRLWELCGKRWWARTEPGWHRPLPREVRRWEESGPEESIPLGRRPVQSDGTSDVRLGDFEIVDERPNAALFRDGASPFRKETEAPPKFGWAHAWGLVRWGKKAGAWGQGVEGLEERKKQNQ